MLNAGLKIKLKRYAANKLMRKRECVAHAISFCSNDYLGLANDPRVIEAFIEGAKHYGVGSTGSQLISGHRDIHQQLEQQFAKFLQRERALLFTNGYMANLGVLQAISQQQTSVYQDKYNHASLIDAALLARVQFKRYPHQDFECLEQQLTKDESPHKLIISDGVFSMSGKITDLNQLGNIAKKHKAILMLDDAHGIGILGEQGRGISEIFNLNEKDLPILVCPLGKAFGGLGAIVAGSNTLIESLVQFARTYIYTTAIPPALASAMLKSLELIQAEPERRQQLHDNISYFKNLAQQYALPFLPSDTPIQVMLIKDNVKVMQLAKKLQEQGMQVAAIRPPTVPEHSARIRISLSSSHTQIQIEKLLSTLKAAYENL